MTNGGVDSRVQGAGSGAGAFLEKETADGWIGVRGPAASGPGDDGEGLFHA